MNNDNIEASVNWMVGVYMVYSNGILEVMDIDFVWRWVVL